MRTTLLAGLLQNLARQLRHPIDAVRFYEIGRTYHLRPGPFDGRGPPAVEKWRLAGLAHGKRNGRTWALPDQAIDFYDVKGAVEVLLHALGIRGGRFEAVEAPQLHPRAAARLWLQDQVAGWVGQVHPRVARAFDIPADTFAFELEMELLVKAAQSLPIARELARFPAVLRDIALVVDAPRAAADVARVIREAGGALLEEVSLFDVYAGERLPAGRKSLAFALRYRAHDKTLTDGEVNAAHERILEEVEARLGGSLRT